MSDKIKIRTGDLELIDSRIFFAYNDKDTKIDLSTSEGQLYIILKFNNSDKDSDQVAKSAKVVDKTTLEITFTNYNHPLGSFTLEPWKIGTINNRDIFLVYTIYGLKGSQFKRMDIAFYLGKEVLNG